MRKFPRSHDVRGGVELTNSVMWRGPVWGKANVIQVWTAVESDVQTIYPFSIIFSTRLHDTGGRLAEGPYTYPSDLVKLLPCWYHHGNNGIWWECPPYHSDSCDIGQLSLLNWPFARINPELGRCTSIQAGSLLSCVLKYGWSQKQKHLHCRCLSWTVEHIQVIP